MLRELAARAKTINVQELALKVAQQNSGLIKERVQQQLIVGENEDGQEVGRYKSERYANFKQRIGSLAPSGVVDLKLSGELQNKLKVGIFPTQYLINSLIDYSKYQIQRYGKKIYGLQKENSEDIKFKNSIGIATEYKRLLGI
ncbi:MAG: hypothetical protein HN347_01230 [Bacteroidetes bacterium]|jgi:hypothetical protein|nr:hypothetical protein [Bacteroidota bacterium]